jgi:hypothetical protein
VTGSFPQAQQTVAYSHTTVAENGTTPYSWSLSGGVLPTGLVLDPITGDISGIPTVIETANFSLTVQDAAGASHSTDFSITVVTPPLTITTTTLPYAMIGSAYNFTMQHIGGGTVTWTILNGGLPTGLTLDSVSGNIFGTPTGAATPSSFVIRVSDGSAIDSRLLAIELDPASTTILKVRKDGLAGAYTTIQTAVNAIPPSISTTHVIEIDDDGVYTENVDVNFTKSTGSEWVSLRSAYDHFPTVQAQTVTSPTLRIRTENVEIRGLWIAGASQAAGIKIDDTVSGPFTVYILSNIITGNLKAIEATLSTGVNILNNSCYGDSGIDANGNPTVRNNIVYATGTGSWAIRSQSLLSDYNLFFAPNGIVGDDTSVTYSTLTAWQLASGGDSNSITGDPLYSNPTAGDFHLQATSPALNKGQSGGGAPLTDANGVARGDSTVTLTTGWDLGGFEDKQTP